MGISKVKEKHIIKINQTQQAYVDIITGLLVSFGLANAFMSIQDVTKWLEKRPVPRNRTLRGIMIVGGTGLEVISIAIAVSIPFELYHRCVYIPSSRFRLARLCDKIDTTSTVEFDYLKLRDKEWPVWEYTDSRTRQQVLNLHLCDSCSQMK